ncbi:hypothetical protein [Actinomadura sp. BRA 177]|nr:hypothetical protein [Actinomadura sp. BRA 177]NVI88264.1 hypothetical protein [Actinomadura sp. BRA 177]
MRSPFIDRREDILPRSLRDLLATEAAAQAADEKRRRRQRRIRTARRAP